MSNTYILGPDATPEERAALEKKIEEMERRRCTWNLGKQTIALHEGVEIEMHTSSGVARFSLADLAEMRGMLEWYRREGGPTRNVTQRISMYELEQREKPMRDAAAARGERVPCYAEHEGKKRVWSYEGRGGWLDVAGDNTVADPRLLRLTNGRDASVSQGCSE